MLRGQLPAPGMLEHVGLPQYAPLAEAVRSGAVRGFNEALLADQHRFIVEARFCVPTLCERTASLVLPHLRPSPARSTCTKPMCSTPLPALSTAR